MASDPTIRAALEAAGEAVRLRARFSPATGKELSLDFASAAIAAFLRAPGVWSAIMEDYEAVTAAVEAEGDGMRRQNHASASDADGHISGLSPAPSEGGRA